MNVALLKLSTSVGPSVFLHRGQQATPGRRSLRGHRTFQIQEFFHVVIVLFLCTFLLSLQRTIRTTQPLIFFFFFCQFFGAFRFWRGRRWQRKFGSTGLGNSDSSSIAGNAFHVVKQAFVVVAWPEPAGQRRLRYQHHDKTENLLHNDFLGCNTRA